MQHVASPDSSPLPLGRRELAAALAPRLRTAGTRTMVVGEAGIGKTHLVDALLETAVPDRAVVRTLLRPEHRGRAFSAIRDLLRSAEWPDGRTEPAARDASEVPVRQLGSTLRSTLRRLAKSGAVVVIDGWQWLDQESRALLERALQDPSVRQSVVVLATRRLDGSAEDLVVQPLFGASEVFAVEPLPAGAITDLIRSSVRAPLSDALATELGRASRGNPLLALELASSADQRDPRRDEPTSFADATRRRLHSLEPDVRQLLATLAVTGPARPADIAMLCESAEDVTARALRTGLATKVGDDLVVPDPLVASIAAEQLSEEERRRMHAVLADAPLPDHVRLEHRDDAAAPGVDEDLASALVDAAARLHRADEPDTALRLVRRSLNRTDRDGQRYWERTIVAAELASTLADSVLVLHLLREVDFERLDLPMLDRAVPLLALTLARRGGAVAVRLRLLPLREALESAAAKDVVALQLATIGWNGSAEEQGGEIERIGARLDETAPRSRRIAQQWEAVLRLDQGGGLSDGQLSSIQSSEPVALQLEDSAAVLAASWAYQSDDLSRSRAGLTAMMRAARLRGEDFVVVQSLAHLAKVELLAGRTDQAVPHLQQAEAGAAALTDVPPAFLAAKGLAAVRRDDGAALQILVDDPQGLSTLGRGAMISSALLGLHAAYSDDWEHALDELLRARRIAERQGIHEPGRRYWIDIELARAFTATGDPVAAEAVAAHVESVSTQPARAHARGQALRIRGLLFSARDQHPEAADLLRRAIVELERGGFRPELVRARAEFAQALHASGSASEAVRQLEVARLEAVRVADPRLDALLRTATARLDQDTAHPALTEAEMRVAMLAASGDTNRSIAEKLFLSPRTVETHLANTYRKLGVRTRTQMGLLLRRPTGA